MVRLMAPDDAGDICRICETALGHPSSSEKIREKIESLTTDRHYYLVVWEEEQNGCVTGFLQAQSYDLLYGECGWNIIALAVEEKNQGRGVGKALLQTLERHAADRGDTFIRLNSRMERPRAHGFYEHMGYCCDKVQKRFIKRLLSLQEEEI